MHSWNKEWFNKTILYRAIKHLCRLSLLVINNDRRYVPPDLVSAVYLKGRIRRCKGIPRERFRITRLLPTPPRSQRCYLTCHLTHRTSSAHIKTQWDQSLLLFPKVSLDIYARDLGVGLKATHSHPLPHNPLLHHVVQCRSKCRGGLLRWLWAAGGKPFFCFYMHVIHIADRLQPQSCEARESLILVSTEPKFAESAYSLAGAYISHAQMWTCVRPRNTSKSQRTLIEW